MTKERKLELAAELEKDIRDHLERWKEAKVKNWDSPSCQLENIYLQGQVYMAMKGEVISFNQYWEFCEALDIRNWKDELLDKEVTDNE